jgi:hypothetical protein
MAGTGDEVDGIGEMGGQPDPRARLMQEVAQQMDAIEADFPDGFEIGRVVTLVEVMGPGERIELRVRAGMYPWVAIGMLQFARKSLEAQIDGGGSGD